MFSAWRPKHSTHEPYPSGDMFAAWRPAGNNETSRGIGKSALRQVGRVGRAAATGIAGLADIPNLAAMGLNAAGLRENPTFYEPIGSRVQQGIDKLTGGSLKPENKAEEYMDIIGEGLAPMALAPLTGGASLTGAAARGLAKTGAKIPSKVAKLGEGTYKPTFANIGQSAGSSAALKAYVDEGGDPGLVGSILASTAGGMGGRSVARNIHKLKNPLNAAAELTGRATGFSPQKYAQNVDIGLPVSLGTVSKSLIPGYAEMIAAKMPGSMGPLEKFYQQRESAIARNLGVQHPEDLEKAVENIPKHLAKEGAENYHARASNIYKQREKKFKGREEEAIKNKETIDVSDLIGDLEKERSLSLTPSAQSRFDKSKEGVLLKELKESIPNSSRSSESESIAKSLRSQGYPEDLIKKVIQSEIGNVEGNTNGIGLHDLNKLREKALHESIALKTPTGGGTPESKRAAVRSQMLGSKRHQFIEEHGSPVEAHNARQARKFWSQYKDKEDGMSKYVAKLTGSDTDEKAFNRLVSDNPKYINIARQGLDKADKSNLASGIISHLGKRQGRFNISTLHTGFQKLPSPVKKEFLRTLPNKSAQNHFERTMELIGDNKRMMEKLANTSNTAHTNKMMNYIEKLGAASASAATGYGLGGLLGVGIQYAGLKLGAHIWTNQKFLKRVNDTITASSEKSKFNKLDLLVKSIEQTGAHTKHIRKEHKE